MELRPRHLLISVALLAAGCGETGPDRAAPPPVAAEPSGGAEPAAAGCPDTFEAREGEPWVPQPPSTQTPGRLAPDADPVEALVCRYTALQDGPSELDGQVLLELGLDRIRHDLLLPGKVEGQQRPCTGIGAALVPHLMRLTYADGELWISSVQDANSCTDTGNGEFVSSAYLGGVLAAAYDSRAWAPPPSRSACSGPGLGRQGQEAQLVPDGWVSLQVCRTGADGEPTPARPVERADAERLAQLLAGLATETDGSSCSGTPRANYNLLFDYAEGPPVALWYAPGCEPSLHNGSLQAAPSAEQDADLEALLAET